LRERKATDRKKVMAMIYGIKNCRKNIWIHNMIYLQISMENTSLT